jgi:hypothetical protein
VDDRRRPLITEQEINAQDMASHQLGPHVSNGHLPAVAPLTRQSASHRRRPVRFASPGSFPGVFPLPPLRGVRAGVRHALSVLCQTATPKRRQLDLACRQRRSNTIC